MKNFVVAAIALLFPWQSHAQKGGMSFSIGYSMPFASEDLIVVISQSRTPEQSGSFGEGFRMAAGIERFVSKQLRVGIDFEVSFSRKFKSDASATYGTANSITTAQAKVFYLLPFIYREWSARKFRVYGKVGTVLGGPTSHHKYSSRSYGAASTVIEQKMEHKFSIGARAGGGLVFDARSPMNLAYFIGLDLIVFKPRQSALVTTKYFSNGTDITGTLTPSQREEPRNDKSPFGSVGVRFGFIRKFG